MDTDGNLIAWDLPLTREPRGEGRAAHATKLVTNSVRHSGSAVCLVWLALAQLPRHLRRRVLVRTDSGRLRMGKALASQAQRAAGAVPTAEPFTHTRSRRVPAPPLRVGIACDISGSMEEYAGPVASATWILGRAASHVPAAVTATVLYGESRP
jgi:hypothetical protein